MKKEFPDEYNFFPATFILPYETSIFKEQFRIKKEEPEEESTQIDGMKKKRSLMNVQKKEKLARKVFIIKPECESQGKGIYLIKNFDDVNVQEHCVAQEYIENPYLLDNLKFDLRIYVLLYGVNPLRIYLFEEGLARFATDPYQVPKK